MKTILICCLVVLTISLEAQDTLKKKKIAFSLSYGFPNFDKKYYRRNMENQLSYLHSRGINTDASINYEVKGLGPLCLKIDIPITSWFSLGPVLAYSQASIQYQFLNPTAYTQTGFVLHSPYTEVNTYKTNSFVGGLRANFHFGKKNKVDPYLGIAFGYKYTSIQTSPYYQNAFFSVPYGYTFFGKYYENPNPNGPLYFALSFGIREYLSKNFGVMIEAGIDNWSYIQAGLVFKSN